MFKNVYKNKKVLITGNTGFKGSWLSSWLLELVKVYGISNNVPTNPSMFEILNLSDKISHFNEDVRNYEKIEKKFEMLNLIFISYGCSATCCHIIFGAT